jgi:hypothetical protein
MPLTFSLAFLRGGPSGVKHGEQIIVPRLLRPCIGVLEWICHIIIIILITTTTTIATTPTITIT